MRNSQNGREIYTRNMHCELEISPVAPYLSSHINTLSVWPMHKLLTRLVDLERKRRSARVGDLYRFGPLVVSLVVGTFAWIGAGVFSSWFVSCINPVWVLTLRPALLASVRLNLVFYAGIAKTCSSGSFMVARSMLRCCAYMLHEWCPVMNAELCRSFALSVGVDEFAMFNRIQLVF